MSEAVEYEFALEVLKRIAEEKRVTRTEFVKIENSSGRVVSQNLVASEALPAFDTAAMDGFAVSANETAFASPGNPLSLRVLASLAAGDDFQSADFKDKSRLGRTLVAYEIMTGAGFPAGTEACIKQEDVIISFDQEQNAKTITITNAVAPGNNRRSFGEDFSAGAPVLQKFHKIRPEDILVLASLGITNIPVLPKLKVCILATGKELVHYTEKPAPPQIRNSSSLYLATAVAQLGADVVSVRSVGDDEGQFLNEVQKAKATDCDLILTTGAISVGKYDFVARVLNEVGLETFFQKVRIRPGKPLLFGSLKDGPLVLGLPGNPVATATGFRFFATPLIRKLQFQDNEFTLRLPLKAPTRKASGVTCFLKARIERETSGELQVLAFGDQRASITNPLLQANAWILLEADKPEHIAANTVVTVYPFGSIAVY